jgi:cold-inducible RNA-binding protein
MGNRLYVGNLAYETTEESLREAFAQYGDIAEIKVILDRDTGRSRGFAFVEMQTQEGANAAVENLNGAMVDGRPLRVNEAEERRPRGGGGYGGGGGGGGYGGGGGGGGGRRGGGGGGSRRGGGW